MKPLIQKAWKQYKEMYREQEEKLSLNEIAYATYNLIWWIAPYILASWQMNIMTPPRKHYHKRRTHRNI